MKIPCSLIFLISCNFLFAQSNIKWDNTSSKDWSPEFEKITITSSLDQKLQSAYTYKSKGINPRPLIISLHTWSGGYDQKDPLSLICIEKDYNYIHPDFRGVNNKAEACGSAFAIQDIEDAISYCLEMFNVDTTEIHIIGVSGGGYATLLSYMNTNHQVKTFSAWASISDIEKWYYESKGRNNKYALDIAKATTNGMDFKEDSHFLGTEEARKRSPYFMETPIEKRTNCSLVIYAGIHDGYTGSVPITQSINMYNKLVLDFDPAATDAIVPQRDIIEMLSSRGFRKQINIREIVSLKESLKDSKRKIGDRIIHYQKQYKDKIKLVIFEGTHEMLTEIALDHIDK